MNYRVLLTLRLTYTVKVHLETSNLKYPSNYVTRSTIFGWTIMGSLDDAPLVLIIFHVPFANRS